MLNFFDLFVLITSAGLAISGFREGFIRGFVKLAGFVITLMLLAAFSHTVTDFVSGFSNGFLEKAINVIVFIALFLIMSLAFHLLASILHGVLKFTPVVFINSGLGCLFGLLKSALLGGIVAALLSLAPQGSFFNNQIKSSRTARGLENLAKDTIPFLKESLKTFNRANQLKQKEENNEQHKRKYPGSI